jgi:DNA-binding response OmpR family regulator
LKEGIGLSGQHHILLVSCGAPFSPAYRLHLELEGYRVSEATRVESVLPLAIGEPPDVILLDPDQSLIDGWHLLGELKTHSVLRDVPVMLLTASVEESDELRARERGAIAFLAKPIVADDLVRAVRIADRQRIPEDAP